MSFRLCSQTTIGTWQFTGVNEIVIKRSVKEIIDTATIKLPAAGRFFYTDKKKLDTNKPSTSIETATSWKEGDPVNILLGYNGDLRQEFKGFVRSVEADIPLKIECEGYSFQLRKKQYNGGSWRDVTLKAVLVSIIQGTDIKLSPLIPNVNLVNLTIGPQNALAALQNLVKHTHLSAYFQFDTLYAGLQEVVTGNTVAYGIGWNVPRSRELEFSLSNARPILVRLVAQKGNAKKRPVIEVGDPSGVTLTENIAFIRDQASIAAIAQQIVNNRNYTGFKGALNALLQPYCNPADTVVITDKKYQVLGASYFAQSIEVKYTHDGAKRIVHLGMALSVPQFEPMINNNIGNL